jgi:hypothetical protein
MNTTETTDEIRYPYYMCGIFKTPARPLSDNLGQANDD